MLNFFLLCALSVFVFGVPHKGSFLTLTLAALLYIIIATGMGLLISTFIEKARLPPFLALRSSR